MATLTIETTHGLSQTQWSKQMFREHLNEIYFSRYMGEGMRDIIMVKSELEKSKGDTLTYGKTYLIDENSGVDGGVTLEGKEQSMEFGDQSFTAVEKRNAVRFSNGLTQQRTAVDIRNTAKEVLTIWKAQETDNKIFTTLTTSPTTNRQVAADSTVAHKAATSASVDDIATTDICTVKGIRRLKLHATTGNAGAAEKIKPYKDGMGNFSTQVFLLFLDPWSLQDLKLDADYTAYATEESRARSKFFEGGVTEIDGVIIIECDKIPRVTNAGSVTVAKNLFMGAGAGAITWAGCELMDGSRGRIQYAEQTFDYGNKVGIAIGDVKGVKKNKFSRAGVAQEDEGVILFYTASIAS
jgi:N4-gp56 family major capsid protein